MTKAITHEFPTQVSALTPVRRKEHRWLSRGLVATGATVALVIAGAGVSLADSSDGTATANVQVTESITLQMTTDSFLLSGLPAAVVTAGDISTLVTTNNFAGYTITVQAAAATLAGAIVGNTDTIPVGALAVNDNLGVLTPLSSTASILLHTQGTESLAAGDASTALYQVTIPFVNADTYTGTLNYVATTL